MRFLKPIILLISLCTLSVGSSEASKWTHEQLEERSLAFLLALDDDRHEDAWQMMNSLFKELNDNQRWSKRQKAIRGAYGSLVNRSTHHLAHRKTYPNSPDGNYVIVQYKSVFANKSNAVETVILHCPDSDEYLVREYVIN